MLLLSLFNLELPLTNPVLKFLLILFIILITPIFLNKIRIPHILGLIIAGAIVGPNGLNLLLRDSGIILSGTAGLLYIMFLAGLEIDLVEFKKNGRKSAVFGMLTFLVPMLLGTLSSVYVLKLSMPSSILVASMYASHTLIAYPILSKLGVNKNRAVNITVGGTVITDTLALLVLAIIVGMETGDVSALFWTRLVVSITLFAFTVMFVFPWIGRWFLKRYEDGVSQYVFILAMVFLGAVLAEAAGIEGIIGAFLSGLALNRLIPNTSALMNRIEFVGNALFIPFFLISVGMLIDYNAFFKDLETIKVAIVMTLIATISKFTAAWLTQKSFHFSVDERRVIFGLSNAQAAATLAAVLVGYNTIIGETITGEPIRLLSESILNGTIIMILITCTIATFSAQKGGRNLAVLNSNLEDKTINTNEKILIAISKPNNIEQLISFSSVLKSKNNVKELYALNIINPENTSLDSQDISHKLLDKAVFSGAAYDIQINKLLRYNLNATNGIIRAIKEHQITDLIIGFHEKNNESNTILGKLTEDVLFKTNVTTFVYNTTQPIATLKRHVVIVTEHAENELGFSLWLSKILNIKTNSSSKIIFYASEKAIGIIKQSFPLYNDKLDLKIFKNTFEYDLILKDLKPDDNLIFVLSRSNKMLLQNNLSLLLKDLSVSNKHNNFILVFPVHNNIMNDESIDLNNPSLIEPIEKLDEIGRSIIRKIKGK